MEMPSGYRTGADRPFEGRAEPGPFLVIRLGGDQQGGLAAHRADQQVPRPAVNVGDVGQNLNTPAAGFLRLLLPHVAAASSEGNLGATDLVGAPHELAGQYRIQRQISVSVGQLGQPDTGPGDAARPGRPSGLCAWSRAAARDSVASPRGGGE
ncbi:hypothetical protein P3T36_004551 [Kitasatospora sp. MAP12-15]|uniref:hypothetical protein n=1 Tax=unclassified Kitasatospora TaxID=2633591 RepID=UPI00247425B1|nr:hypothetical protein [Kitasatospora sp. MAP12-44]MDH6111397.1 hypothetical protein [Kitasatospora sp. MAP12-44]